MRLLISVIVIISMLSLSTEAMAQGQPGSFHIKYKYQKIYFRMSTEEVNKIIESNRRNTAVNPSNTKASDQYRRETKDFEERLLSLTSDSSKTYEAEYWSSADKFAWLQGTPKLTDGKARVFDGKTYYEEDVQLFLGVENPTGSKILDVGTSLDQFNLFIPYLGFTQSYKSSFSSSRKIVSTESDGKVYEVAIGSTAKYVIDEDSSGRILRIQLFKKNCLYDDWKFSRHISLGSTVSYPKIIEAVSYRYSRKDDGSLIQKVDHLTKLDAISADANDIPDSFFAIKSPPVGTLIQDNRPGKKGNQSPIAYTYNNSGESIDQASQNYRHARQKKIASVKAAMKNTNPFSAFIFKLLLIVTVVGLLLLYAFRARRRMKQSTTPITGTTGK